MPPFSPLSLPDFVGSQLIRRTPAARCSAVTEHTGARSLAIWIAAAGDPTASHYLKLLMDAIFQSDHFRNEIVWLRATPRGHAFTRFASAHDVLLCYSKGEGPTWNEDAAFLKYDLSNLDEKTHEKYSLRDPDGRRYQLTSLLNPNFDRPNLKYEFLGITRVWRWTKDRMQDAYEAGLVVQPNSGAVPRFKRYLDEQKGKPIGDVWADIPPINSQAQERLGYPTQKPEALLQRIVQASSNEDDVILDPFCGCGTSISVAERLHRKWIGIDITHLAITLIRHRLFDHFKSELAPYEVIGDPRDVASARALALEDRYQFQFWAAGLVDAFPAQGHKKKGADSGIDGIINFVDDNSGLAKKIIVQVKSGHVKAGDIRDLKGVVEREKAAIGAFITLEEPTAPMKTEAVSAGFYESALKLEGGTAEKFQRIQILTIVELLEGRKLAFPRHVLATFKQAERKSKSKEQQVGLF